MPPSLPLPACPAVQRRACLAHDANRSPAHPQSLVLAPLFVWFELLFLLGLFPDLRRRVQARVRANIAAWKRGQRKKRA